MNDPDQNPLLSIIVCTFNRSDLLSGCLASLVTQPQPPAGVEIVIVDNNSADDTAQVVSRFAQQQVGIRYLSETRQGLSHARNCGAQKARGAYLVYIDDDGKVPEGYVCRLAKVIEEFQPDIAGGPIYPFYTSPKPPWFRDVYETRQYSSVSGFSDSVRISGGNFIIRRAVLASLGGFDPALGMQGGKLGLGEEAMVLDLYRLKTPAATRKVYYSMECFLYHHVPAEKMTVRYQMVRCYHSGRLNIRVAALHHSVTWKSCRMAGRELFAKPLSQGWAALRLSHFHQAECIDMLRCFAIHAGRLRESIQQVSRKKTCRQKDS